MPKVEILGLAAGLPRTDITPGPAGDAAAARTLLETLFPGRIGATLPPADLPTACYPEYGRIYAGTFGATAVVCGNDLRELPDLAAATAPVAGSRAAIRLQINGAAESVALEILGPGGVPARELMVLAEEGVIADEGPRLDFELPFWAGEVDPDGAYAAVNGAEMPFDVIDFGQEALRTLFGFDIEDHPGSRPGDLDGHQVMLHGFVIAADSDDPSDMAQARSGGPVPELPTDLADRTHPPRVAAADPAAVADDPGRRRAGRRRHRAGRDGCPSWSHRLLSRLRGCPPAARRHCRPPDVICARDRANSRNRRPAGRGSPTATPGPH